MSAKKFLTENATKLLVVEDLPGEETKLDSNITNAALGLKLIGKTPEVTSDDVDDLKKIMNKKVFAGLKKALSKSRSMKDTKLINMFSFHADYILKSDKVIAPQRCLEIRDLLEAKMGILTTVKVIDVTAITTSVANFNAVKDIPVMSIKNRKSFGTALYNSSLAAGRDELKTIQMMIEGQLEESDKDFTEAYRSSIVITILGVRHTPMNVTFVDEITGKTISTVDMISQKKSGRETTLTSTVKGVIARKSQKLGNTDYVGKVAGYADAAFSIKPKKGVLSKITVRMLRID